MEKAQIQMMRWYVVYTQPRTEAKALWHLENQGLHCFLPRIRRLRRHARKIEPELAPLFPRYLFTQFDLSATRWRAVNGTRGVVGLVANGPYPLPVPEGLVEELLAQCEESGAVPLSALGIFTQGVKVRITSGTFIGQKGEIAEIAPRDPDRVLVLLNFLGVQARIEVPSYAIEAA
jgi:transcriptional antiterminator RfaH